MEKPPKAMAQRPGSPSPAGPAAGPTARPAAGPEGGPPAPAAGPTAVTGTTRAAGGRLELEALPETVLELDPTGAEPPPVRLGLVVPSSNAVMEVDFYSELPTRITLHTARAHLQELTPEGLARMLDEHVPRALRDLATVQPRAVVFGCTAAEVLRGSAGEAQLAEQVERLTGAPCITTARAACRRLLRLGARRVWLVTPYAEELTRRLEAYLRSEGFEVAEPVSGGLTSNPEIGRMRPEGVVQFVYEQRLKRFGVGRLPVDAAFISCTNLRAAAVRRRLESVLGVPVVTSSTAALGAALELLETLSAGEPPGDPPGGPP